MEQQDRNLKDANYAPLEDARRWRVGAISGWITAGVLALALIPATCTRDRVSDDTPLTGNAPVVAPVDGAVTDTSASTVREGTDVARNEAEGDMAAGGGVTLNREIDLFRGRTQSLIEQGRVEVLGSDGRTGIRFQSVSFFEPGQASLTSDGAAAMGDLLNALGDLEGRIVYFEGHADDNPTEGTPFASNWELAAARAAAAAKLAIDRGLPPRQAVVVSYGDTRPAIASGDTSPQAQAQNRRVSLSILPMSAADSDRFSQR